MLNKTLKYTAAALTLAATTLGASAVPARPDAFSLRQPDGSYVQVRLIGDEHGACYTTLDGWPLIELPDGTLVYARTDADGNIVPSDLRASQELTSEQEAIMAKEWCPAVEKSIDRRRRAARAIRNNVAAFPNTGEVHGLIILAEFSDVPFNSRNANMDFTAQMNEEGYSRYGASGSARDYFLSQSGGKFQPTFDVVGPVRLPHDMEFYGGNTVGAGSDKDAPQMVVDACRGAAEMVDFSKYDYDEDGNVDLVFIIYSGYNEAQGGGSRTIWPHAWDLLSAGKQLRLNGKNISRYACTSELMGYEGGIPDGIGTFCHEFAHCLGLPDVYDAAYTGMIGMGAWDLMDSGGYNNNSRTPAAFTAYEREFCGWLNLTELTEPQSGLTLRNIVEHNEGFKIVSPYNPNEYYTFENRQPVGWDAALPGHGLIISHIDYDENIWRQNVVNTAAGDHAHIQIVPSRGQAAYIDDAAWPGSTGNTAFMADTRPASTLFMGNAPLDAPVTDIAEDGDVITFNFKTYLKSPAALTASDIHDNGFTAHWAPIDNAESYTLLINAVANGLLIDSFDEEAEITVTPENEWASATYPLNDHHTFTLHMRPEGERTAMNGLRATVRNTSGKEIVSKAFTIRGYDKDEYWVFSSAEAGYLELTASVPVKMHELRLYNGNVEADLREGKTPETSDFTFSRRIEGLTDNSFAVDGLRGGTEYVYQVLGVNDSFSARSLPSNKVVVSTTGDPLSGIFEATADGESFISGTTGGVNVWSLCETEMAVYGIDGNIIRAAHIGAGTTFVALPRGIYIVRAGKTTAKILVR